jgi:site-specific recombinase XerD
MTTCNAENERIKRRYFDHLKEAEGLAPVTVEHTRRAICEYERFTNWADFKRFSRNGAIGFRKSLLAGDGKRKAHASSRATVHSKLMRVEKFFRWLAGQPGFKTRIAYTDVECFGLSRRDQAIARQRSKEQPTPSLEQVLAAIRALPADTDLQLRDRALVACLLLTACRIKALTTLRLKHVRKDRLGIDLDARDVDTKFAKSFTTFFVPIGDDIRQMLLDYVDHLRSLGFADEDPLFPKTVQGVGSDHSFVVAGLAREPWKDVEAARRVCRRAFAAASIPYYPPQAVRRTVIRVGEKRCRTPEEFKAWSQNVGHEDPLTSFRNYGEVSLQRQAELIANLTEGDLETVDELELIAQLASRLRNNRLRRDK